MRAADLGALLRAAENLTDRLAALRLLVHHGLDGCERSARRVHARYRDNPLVLDKWFAVQATAPEPRRARRASRRSARHPTFSFKNPNRVYALIRSFAAANPVGFNRPDGAGYRFVAGVISDLDRQNPSVAARHRHRLPLLAHAGAARRGHRRGSAAEHAAGGAACRATSATS